MWERRALTRELSRLADRQGGTITRAQALPTLGVHAVRRLVRSGEWSVVTPGIYATSGTPTARQRLWAGHLLGGPGSALGGEAALFLTGLRPEPAVVETWVPLAVRRDPRPGWVFPRDGWGRLDHTRGTLPVIRTDEALIDVGQHLDVEAWIELLAAAARAETVSLVEVERRIRLRPRVAQRHVLLDVLADFRGIESNLEFAYLREVEQRHGLPTASRQVVVVAGARCDVRYEGYAVIVELDGRLHLGQEFRDMRRDNAHAVRQERTLRYGTVDVRGSPCGVAWQVGGVLVQQGWTGRPVRCPRCPSQAELDRMAGFG